MRIVNHWSSQWYTKMAYISPQERQRKKEAFDAYVLQIFLEEGWEAISYERVSKHFKTTNSSIQRYYPHRADFGNALSGHILPILAKHLKFDTKQVFIESWAEAMHDWFFAMVIKMIIENSVVTNTDNNIKKGVYRMVGVLENTMTNEEAVDALESVLGKSVMFYMNQSLTSDLK